MMHAVMCPQNISVAQFQCLGGHVWDATIEGWGNRENTIMCTAADFARTIRTGLELQATEITNLVWTLVAKQDLPELREVGLEGNAEPVIERVVYHDLSIRRCH